MLQMNKNGKFTVKQGCVKIKGRKIWGCLKIRGTKIKDAQFKGERILMGIRYSSPDILL